MQSLMDSMLAYWIVLLGFSLGTAALIYVFWLRDALI